MEKITPKLKRTKYLVPGSQGPDLGAACCAGHRPWGHMSHGQAPSGSSPPLRLSNTPCHLPPREQDGSHSAGSPAPLSSNCTHRWSPPPNSHSTGSLSSPTSYSHMQNPVPLSCLHTPTTSSAGTFAHFAVQGWGSGIGVAEEEGGWGSSQPGPCMLTLQGAHTTHGLPVGQPWHKL